MSNTIKNDFYKKLRQKSKRHKYLYHYTNIDSLRKIIISKSLRLTKLGKVNDPYEDKRIINLHKDKIYVACFTHRQHESVFLWKEYTNKKDGVIIRFTNFNNYEISIYGEGNYNFNKIQRSDLAHKSYDNVSDWEYFDITIADIAYTNDFSKYRYTDIQLKEFFSDAIILGNSNDNFIINECQGLMKGIEWDSEKETRIIVALRPKGMENILSESAIIQPKPKFDYIYLKLNEGMLNKLQIIMNPWATNEFKSKIEEIIAEAELESCKIVESGLKGRII